MQAASRKTYGSLSTKPAGGTSSLLSVPGKLSSAISPSAGGTGMSGISGGGDKTQSKKKPVTTVSTGSGLKKGEVGLSGSKGFSSGTAGSVSSSVSTAGINQQNGLYKQPGA